MEEVKREIKYIQDEKKRNTCFEKRRKDLVKEVRELSALIGTEVIMTIRKPNNGEKTCYYQKGNFGMETKMD